MGVAAVAEQEVRNNAETLDDTQYQNIMSEETTTGRRRRIRRKKSSKPSIRLA